jgi:hypothetical protein
VPPAWLDELEPAAPGAVGAFRGIEAGQFLSVRRQVRRYGGVGSTPTSVAELATLAEALAAVVGRLPEQALRAPGGEEDWNVAQAVGHVSAARAGLVMAASLAAADRWPADAPTVVPGVPGSPTATREQLLRRIAQSQRVIERAARAVAGHESDPCPLEHPLVGRLRCGEWLVFAAVHDLMHLEQLHRIEAQAAADFAGRLSDAAEAVAAGEARDLGNR